MIGFLNTNQQHGRMNLKHWTQTKKKVRTIHEYLATCMLGAGQGAIKTPAKWAPRTCESAAMALSAGLGVRVVQSKRGTYWLELDCVDTSHGIKTLWNGKADSVVSQKLRTVVEE
jgi:hypothetical protein